jgi:hypothetical protein
MDRHCRVFEFGVRLGRPTGMLNPGVRLGINTQANDQRTLKRPGDSLIQPGRFSGLRPLALGFTPGWTPVGKTRLVLKTGVLKSQERLGINTQANDRRTLKRPAGLFDRSGRLSGLRLLALGFTPGGLGLV